MKDKTEETGKERGMKDMRRKKKQIEVKRSDNEECAILG
jgi:hypothetical protein